MNSTTSHENLLESADVRQKIAERAYYLSEASGFRPDCELDCWLQAEAETIQTLTTATDDSIIKDSTSTDTISINTLPIDTTLVIEPAPVKPTRKRASKSIAADAATSTEATAVVKPKAVRKRTPKAID